MSKTQNRLYTFRRCPYAIAARLALKFADIAVEMIEVDLKNKPLSLYDCSKKATVPVLVLPDKVIDESRDIVDWVVENSPSALACLSEVKIKTGNDWLEKLTKVFIPALNRYKYASRYDAVDLLLEEKKLLLFFSLLNQALSEDCLLSSMPSKFDIIIFPFIRQADIANSTWLEQYPKLNIWFQNWTSHPVFITVMER